MKQIILLLMVLGSLVVQAQNNAIFNGGVADGWHKNAYQQSANNIYTGGNGDGWHFHAFAQSGNALFNGGNGDGWHFNAFAQTGNSIFGGGQGDGWASVYRPQGSLPVTWISFTARKQGATSVLQWQTAAEQNSAYFDIERSSTSDDFQRIGAMSASGNSNSTATYNYVDATPQKNANFYRIKQVDKDGKFTYTPVRLVNFDESNNGTLLAYPVPATTKLFVSVPAEFVGHMIMLSVLSSEGRLVKQQQVNMLGGGQLLQLDVSSLPFGVYHVKVATPKKQASTMFVKQ
ncbi:MAG: T9SS type A sorting domain-containing protein [Bacteroidales bacterium]|nr:T9SS type A sorting domain-containing protein [Bacteroidales bacterium]